MANSWSYEEAVEQAIKLHKQGLTYPKIEEHFRKIGYISSRTKKPIGALAIRHMVKAKEARDEKLDIEDAKEMKVVGPSFKDTVSKLAGVPGIDDMTFLSLIKALVAQHEKLASK